MGNYWFNFDEPKAVNYWQTALSADTDNYLALRNLAFITMRARKYIEQAISLYQRAVSIQPLCVNLIVEYIAALRLGGRIAEALEYINNVPETLAKDYRIIKTKAFLLRDNCKFEQSISLLLSSGNLYVWEDEHNPRRCYLECLMALGTEAMEKNDFEKAKNYFMAMLEYPEQLLHSKSSIENESAAYYHLGLLSEKMGDSQKATEYYTTAMEGPSKNQSLSSDYGLNCSENEYFTALAAEKLGDREMFDKTVTRLTSLYDANFSASGVEFLPTNNLYANHLASARGFMLIRDFDKARKCLDNLKQTFGDCWPLEQAENELNCMAQKDF